MSAQLELLAPPPANHRHWRESLKRWPGEAFHWRHARNTTGWSMVRQDFIFAELLFRAGEMKQMDLIPA